MTEPAAMPPLNQEGARRSRARRAVDSGVRPTPGLPDLDELPRRRLSHDERRALRERHLSVLPPLPEESAGRRAGGRPAPPAESAPAVESEAIYRPPLHEPVRSARPPGRGRDRAGARTVTLGALLFLGLVAVSIGAGGVIRSGGDSRPTPTATPAPTAVVPLAAAPETPSPTPPATPTIVPSLGRWPGEGDGRIVVCLDPGHGGWDPGWVRLNAAGQPSMAEGDYNLAHAYDLANRLRAQGFEVVMTRLTPNAVNAEFADVNGDGQTMHDSERAGELDELQARIDICNEANADLLVSMHVNGFDRESPTAQGYETWYTGSRPFGDLNARFATLAFDALGKSMTAAGYTAMAREINNDDTVSVDTSNRRLLSHMVITGPDVPGAVRASEMPGAIIECLFISHDADAAFLSSDAGHEAIVSAYVAAIVAYFEEVPG